jgi:hypothetical protein
MSSCIAGALLRNEPSLHFNRSRGHLTSLEADVLRSRVVRPIPSRTLRRKAAGPSEWWARIGRQASSCRGSPSGMSLRVGGRMIKILIMISIGVVVACRWDGDHPGTARGSGSSGSRNRRQAGRCRLLLRADDEQRRTRTRPPGRALPRRRRTAVAIRALAGRSRIRLRPPRGRGYPSLRAPSAQPPLTSREPCQGRRDVDFVLDHEVKLSDGTTFNNPMRVIDHGTGCEVVFTLVRRPDRSDDDYEADATAIRALARSTGCVTRALSWERGPPRRRRRL